MTYTEEDVRRMPLSDARRELLEEIMSVPTLESVETRDPDPRRQRWVLPAAAAAAAVLAIGLPLAVANSRSESSGPQTPVAGQSPSDASSDPAAKHGFATIGGETWAITGLSGTLDQGQITLESAGRVLVIEFGIREQEEAEAQLAGEFEAEPERLSLFTENRPATLWSDGSRFVAVVHLPIGGPSYATKIHGSGMDRAGFLKTVLALKSSDLDVEALFADPED